MFGLGTWELIIILAIVVILFGAKRLPLVGEGMGKMISNFKKANKKAESIEDKNTVNNVEKTATETQKEEIKV